MILSIEAFIKPNHCISCGKKIFKSKKFCHDCNSLLRQELISDRLKDYKANLKGHKDEN